jgi:hypothetical protein
MSIKQEEIVPLADMLVASFERDQKEFEAENGFYSPEFLKQFKQEAQAVRELEKADVLLTQQKTTTKELYLLADNLYQPLKLFAIVIEKAGLPTGLIPEIIANLKSRNIEAGLVNIKALSQIVNGNLELLTSKAMKPKFPELLATSFNEITSKSNLQTKIKQDRQLLTDNNLGSYDTLYNTYITDLCKMGKAVYHGKAKVKEYTVTSMLKKLHTTATVKSKTI